MGAAAEPEGDGMWEGDAGGCSDVQGRGRVGEGAGVGFGIFVPALGQCARVVVFDPCCDLREGSVSVGRGE